MCETKKKNMVPAYLIICSYSVKVGSDGILSI